MRGQRIAIVLRFTRVRPLGWICVHLWFRIIPIARTIDSGSHRHGPDTPLHDAGRACGRSIVRAVGIIPTPVTTDPRSQRPTVVILVRDTRIPGGTSLCDAGYTLEAIANSDTRNKSEYDDFIGRPRVNGGSWYNNG